MPQPNVLLITSAGWREECLGWRITQGAISPNLHALSSQAARGQVQDTAEAMSALRAGFSSAIRSAGYSTAFVGELGVAPEAGVFDVALTAENDRTLRESDTYHSWLMKEGFEDRGETWRHDFNLAPLEVRQALGATRSALPERAHVTTWIGVNAVRFLQQAVHPFFLWVHFPRPAFPFDPPSPWEDLVPRATLSLPRAVGVAVAEGATFANVALSEPRLRRVWSHYLGNAALVDHQVGRLLSTLTSRAVSNTAVVFASISHTGLGEGGKLYAWSERGDEAKSPLPFYAAGAARTALEGSSVLDWEEFATRMASLTTTP